MLSRVACMLSCSALSLWASKQAFQKKIFLEASPLTAEAQSGAHGAS